MDRAGLQLKPAQTPRQLTLVERARQLLPRPARVLSSFRAPSPSLEREPSNSGWSRVRNNYLLLVVLPSLAYLFYAAVMETPAYVSETRVSVQSPPKKGATLSAGSASMISRLIGSVASDTERDSYLVLN